MCNKLVGGIKAEKAVMLFVPLAKIFKKLYGGVFREQGSC